jgi:hypothetical protein
MPTAHFRDCFGIQIQNAIVRSAAPGASTLLMWRLRFFLIEPQQAL